MKQLAGLFLGKAWLHHIKCRPRHFEAVCCSVQHLATPTTPLRLNSTASLPTDRDYVMHRLVDEVERPSKYRPGGYHPVIVGDKFNDRYHIVDKLGHGAFSTIWLARDEKAERYIALKICNADSKNQETDILRDLSDISFLEEPGWSMIPRVYEQFESLSPNGRHKCYVTSTARCSVAEITEFSMFQIEVARKLIAQLIVAVAYIHSRGIVHGDIHFGNILLHLPSTLDKLSIQQFYREYGEPRVEPIERYDKKPLGPHVPPYATEAIWLGRQAEKITLVDAHIILSDFGEAFSPLDPERIKLGEDCHTPRTLGPPEALFEPQTPMSFASDIWTLANVIWCLLGQGPLTSSFFNDKDEITFQRIEILGSFPPDWWVKWDARHEYYDEESLPKEAWEGPGTLDEQFERDVQKLRRKRRMPKFDEREKQALLAMLRPMLAFRPENRPTTQMVLKSDWMINWGLSTFESSRYRVEPWLPLTASMCGL